MQIKMKSRVFVAFFLIFCLDERVESCLSFAYKKISNRQFSRKMYSTPSTKSCVCGKETSYRFKQWTVYIHTKSKPSQPCIGTVIAHNLVVTSHTCLIQEGKAILPYDLWQPRPSSRASSKVILASAADVTVSIVTLAPFKDGTWQRDFTVKNIAYNAGHGLYAGLEAASANDIAVIVLNDDLFQIVEFNHIDANNVASTYKENLRLPVCIPEKRERKDVLEKTLNRFGYYYGYDENSADFMPLKIKVANQIVIMGGDECDQEAKFGDFATDGVLCARAPVDVPKREGGPLLTTNSRGFLELKNERAGEMNVPVGKQTAYLLGISTGLKSREGVPYTYFANVHQNLNFIQQVALEHASMWCASPSQFSDAKKAEASERKLEEMPWETSPIKPRSETLKCACGLTSKDVDKAAGENPVPVEFGWMVKFMFAYDAKKRPGEGYVCGASIINDRVLLTAGHCLVEDNDKDFPDGIPYEILEASHLYVGLRQPDLMKSDQFRWITAKKLFVHPGFIPNQKSHVTSDDLVVIVLAEPLKFSTATASDQVTLKDVRPICLPKAHEKIELKSGTKLTAAGWGIPDSQHPMYEGLPPVLQKIELMVQDIKSCEEKVADFVPKTVFCSSNFTKLFGPAQGDSGGPLAFIKPSNGKYYQVSVVSYGIVGLDPKEPDNINFNVDLQQYLPFIEYYSAKEGAQWCKY